MKPLTYSDSPDFNHRQLGYRLDSISNNSLLTEEERDQRYQDAGHEAFSDYDPSQFCWGPIPPEPWQCLQCYEWKRFPPGQEHFGWAWWRICNCYTCKCAHHETEVWIA